MHAVIEELGFWNRAEPIASGCLIWQGSVNDSGYGRVGEALTGEIYAHRAAYVLVNGPVPDGYTVAHLCHERDGCRGGESCPHRPCIEPSHLEARPRR